MKITQIDDGRVLLELESPKETLALWAVAARVGGTEGELRELFSARDSRGQPGLFEALTPIVTDYFMESSKANKDLRRQPFTIGTLMRTLCQSRVGGRIEINTINDTE